jgi:phage terminase small subunit
MTTLPTPTAGRQLTRRQAAFVDALLRNGGNKREAALEAGFSQHTAHVQAHEVMRLPHVIAALMERSMIELAGQAPKAINTLAVLMEGKSEYVRLEAAKDLLDRLGLRAPDRTDLRVAGDITVKIDLS